MIKTPRIEKRERRYLTIVIVIAIAFAIFSIGVTLLDRLFEFFSTYSRFPFLEYSIINVIFLILACLLWLTYRKWKIALKKQNELEDIIDSIAPDVFLVVDSDNKISICNKSVEKMFGYEVGDILGKSTDCLFKNGVKEKLLYDEIYEKLRNEGFDIGLGTGKKRDGRSFPVELIKGVLSNEQGAVLLLRDITERRRTEEEIKKYRNRLEELVIKRTGELTETVDKLEKEITERKRTEKLLQKSEKKLSEQNILLRDKNIALREVLKQVQVEKEEMEAHILDNVDRILLPLISKLKSEESHLSQQSLELLEKTLKKITDPFGSKISRDTFKLTRREMEICNMIKNGLTSKEIAKLLNISTRTVEKHRNHIRKKLGIIDKDINLATYLNTLPK